MRTSSFPPQKTKSFRRNLSVDAKYSHQFAKVQTFNVTIALICAHLAAGALEFLLSSISFNTMILRVTASVIILLFWSRERAPIWIRRNYHILWSAYLGFVFPYCYGTILILDAAYAPEDATINMFAVTEYIVSAFFLVQLAFHPRLILVIWLSASLLVAAQTFALDELNLRLILETSFVTICFFATVMLVGGVINHRLFDFQRDKEKAVWNVANSIAHQLRTPLASIRNYASATDRHLTLLTEGYQTAKREQLIDSPLNNSKITTLAKALKTIQEQVTHSLSLIDILIANANPATGKELTPLPIKIKPLIERAVESFPYNNPNEKALIHLDLKSDFQVLAPDKIILHVMYNLIANAVEFSQKTKDALIKIGLTQKEEWNEVTVWDNGIGVTREHQQIIFEPFFSLNSPHGTGIGLSFCKNAMEKIGGEIECRSTKGQFCEFTLRFPKCPKPLQNREA